MSEKMLIMAIIPKSDWLSCRARMMPNTMPSSCCTVLFRPPQSSPFAVFSFRVSAIVMRLRRCSMLLRSVQCPSDSSRRLRRCSMLLRSVQCPSGCSMLLRSVQCPSDSSRRLRRCSMLLRSGSMPFGLFNAPVALFNAASQRFNVLRTVQCACGAVQCCFAAVQCPFGLFNAPVALGAKRRFRLKAPFSTAPKAHSQLSQLPEGPLNRPPGLSTAP